MIPERASVVQGKKKKKRKRTDDRENENKKLEMEREAAKHSFFKAGNGFLTSVTDANKEMEILYLTSVTHSLHSSPLFLKS